MTGEGRESNRVLKRMQVPLKATLLQAMRAINSGGAAIAFAVNDRGKVLGTITDGDLRRAILNGATLQDCAVPAAMRKDFTFVSGRSGRVEVLDMMRARGISQVPILDRHGRLVGLHLLQDLIGAGPKPNWAVILAGGRGERLHPLTLHVPKPMIPVAGRPILERLVLQLVGVGIRRIFLSVNYLAEVIERHFRDGERFGCSIEYLRGIISPSYQRIISTKNRPNPYRSRNSPVSIPSGLRRRSASSSPPKTSSM